MRIQSRQGDVFFEFVTDDPELIAAFHAGSIEMFDLNEIQRPSRLHVLEVDKVRVALGEQTGHEHVVVAEREEDVVLTVDGSREPDIYNRFLNGDALAANLFAAVEVKSPGQLEHRNSLGNLTTDHTPIQLKPGLYQVIPQRQYDPKVGEIRAWD